MALGGLGVAAGVGLARGSAVTLLYAVAGGVLWHLVARPMEERDLAARFGPPYERYRAAVRCWWPGRPYPS
jgi:protein-S-isoprenylcysteine O-methyltransferase Ste14